MKILHVNCNYIGTTLHQNMIELYFIINKVKYYRQADIFVMPSHKETFGLVYAEAMS